MRIKNNETADKAAKDISEMATARLPYTDYYPAIRRAISSEWLMK